MSPNKKFLFIKSTFNFDVDADTLYSSSVSSVCIFDDFDSAYEKLKKDAQKEYSNGINIYDAIGRPDFEYLYDNSAVLISEGRDFISRFDIFEVESLLDNPSNIILVSSMHNTNYKAKKTEIAFIQKDTPFQLLSHTLKETKTSFLEKFNLSPEDITLCEIIAV